jgi:hypothetical protein
MDDLIREEIEIEDGEPGPWEAPDNEDHVSLLGGGIDPPPSWDEFLDEFQDEFHPHLEAARRWLVACGAPYPSASRWRNDHYLRFSDGITLTFT